MSEFVISGTGLFTPPETLSNRELVEAFNCYVDQFNQDNDEAIKRGDIEALEKSSEAFIEKASGIKSRFCMNKSGIIDPKRMKPYLKERTDEEHSLQCEMSIHAAKEAITKAQITPDNIGMVIVACSNLQRAYPAVAIEVQQALGIHKAFAFDMNVACSSATFAIQMAYGAIASGSVDHCLIVNPEICTAHLNFKSRDCHFIFGDACTAMIVQKKEAHQTLDNAFKILDVKALTQYSSNIRNNFGFLNNADEEGFGLPNKLFYQHGRKVFKEVVPMVSKHILEHLKANKIDNQQVKRFWLHQANDSMNLLISKKVLEREPQEHETPIILDEYANTSSAGSIIAFHKYNQDLKKGDLGVICAFGAGYSVGSVILEKI